MRYSHAVRALLLIPLSVVACVRDPDDSKCPALAAGDLVVTEIRGPQTAADTTGSWIELYNASGAATSLDGLRVRFRKKDGSGELDALVRRDVPLAAGAYAVLGLDDDAQLPDEVDYGFASDFHGSAFLPNAAIDVEACGVLIDRAQYDALPRTGTFSLGAQPPTADANDFPTAWCTDPSPSGTPRAENIACP
jgi:hypothetical protein